MSDMLKRAAATQACMDRFSGQPLIPGKRDCGTFDANGMAVSSQWSGEMWRVTRVGDQSSPYLPTPIGLKNNAQMPSWGAGYLLSGKACTMLVMGENSKRTAYPNGEVKPLEVILAPECWDPRKDSPWPGGSGTCRLNDPSTSVWSENPTIFALKWALGLWQGPTGRGAPQVDQQVGGIGAKLSGTGLKTPKARLRPLLWRPMTRPASRRRGDRLTICSSPSRRARMVACQQPPLRTTKASKPEGPLRVEALAVWFRPIVFWQRPATTPEPSPVTGPGTPESAAVIAKLNDCAVRILALAGPALSVGVGWIIPIVGGTGLGLFGLTILSPTLWPEAVAEWRIKGLVAIALALCTILMVVVFRLASGGLKWIEAKAGPAELTVTGD